MNRRTILISGLMSSAAILVATNVPAFADPPEPTSSGGGGKKIPPTFVPEVPVMIQKCITATTRVCNQIVADMNRINAILDQMRREVERRMQRSGLTRQEQNNLKRFRDYLRKEHKRLHEVATGRSPSWVSARNRNVGKNFCEKAAESLAKAAKNRADYRSRGRTNRERVADMKAAVRNVRAANRTIENARDGFIRRTRPHDRQMSKTNSVDITNGIYTAARKRQMEAAINRLMNSSSKQFDITVKIAELEPIARRIYGRW